MTTNIKGPGKFDDEGRMHTGVACPKCESFEVLHKDGRFYCSDNDCEVSFKLEDDSEYNRIFQNRAHQDWMDSPTHLEKIKAVISE